MDEMVHIFDHPLIQHKLAILRDECTGVKEFREIVSEIASLMCSEATRDLPTEEVTIKTPVATGKFKTLAGKNLAIVPISVSYTHLDVYKRQPSSCTGRRRRWSPPFPMTRPG